MAAKKSKYVPGIGINGKPVTWEEYNSGAFLRAMLGSATPQQPAAPPAPTVPETIQVTPPPPPPLDPFFTPDDINAMSEWLRGVDDTRTTVDSQLNTAGTDTKFQTGQLNQSAKRTTDQANENMAGRGLFQGSVRDAALFDIEAQRATQEGYLNDRLKQITSEHDSWVSKYGGTMSNGTKIARTDQEAKDAGLPLGTATAAWYQGWAAKAGQNAVEVNANRPTPQPITVPNPDFHPLATPPAKGTGVLLPLGAAAVRPASQRPANTASGVANAGQTSGTATPGSGPVKKTKKKTYLSGATTP